jgi:hypothetical protein
MLAPEVIWLSADHPESLAGDQGGRSELAYGAAGWSIVAK